VDYGELAPTLRKGGVNADGERWSFESPVTSSLLDRATTVWVVPWLADGRTATVRLSSGRHHIPGGTVEPGEQWSQCASREIAEELGASILKLSAVGAIVGPKQVRVVSWAEITNPMGPHEPDTNEPHVVSFVLGDITEAVALLDGDDQHVLADIYRLVHLDFASRRHT
jgi:ADP-ribose pyrophosphatase YjhB (NUDIX family)